MEKRNLVVVGIALALSLVGLILGGVALLLTLTFRHATATTAEPALVRVVVEVATPPPVPVAESWSQPAPARPFAMTTPQPPPPPNYSGILEMTACAVSSETVSATFAVRSSAPVALFFDPPALSDGENSTPPTPDSLREAQFASLNRITSGYAEFTLVFPTAGLDPNRMAWTVVFNPRHGENDPVAPRFSFECRR